MEEGVQPVALALAVEVQRVPLGKRDLPAARERGLRRGTRSVVKWEAAVWVMATARLPSRKARASQHDRVGRVRATDMP
jgi:hypothetical protein